VFDFFTTACIINQTMNNKVELYCTYDDDDKEWVVWFPHPLGGKNVLDTFDNEADARKFWQEQINTSEGE